LNQVSKISDMFSLTLDHDEATYLSHENLIGRRERIQNSYSPDGLANLKKSIDEYIAGQRELTALEFYLAFEQASLLLLFHAFPRRGERNRHANGLQQTYGDHIRLMMLGFDMFDRSDIGWLMKRRWHDPVDVDQPELEDSIKRYHDLNLTRSEKAAYWTATALHDYGKIFRRGYGLDAEDAAPLCDKLVEVLAPDGMVELINYGIRNHDLIEHTVTGDTPARFIKEPIETLPEGVRARAMPMLALIQHIGAASLGDGRVSKSKLDIYNACLSGDIVADDSVEARLGRFLFGAKAVPDASAKARASAVLAGLTAADRTPLTKLLDGTLVLGWNNVREAILADEDDNMSKALPRLVKTLLLVGRSWSEQSTRPSHVVLARPQELAKCTRPGADNGARPKNEDKATQLLNGASALILR
jgi:hypothetical protein